MKYWKVLRQEDKVIKATRNAHTIILKKPLRICHLKDRHGGNRLTVSQMVLLDLPWASRNQFIRLDVHHTHNILLSRNILFFFSSVLSLDIYSGNFPKGTPNKTLHSFLFSPMLPTCSSKYDLSVTTVKMNVIDDISRCKNRELTNWAVDV